MLTLTNEHLTVDLAPEAFPYTWIWQIKDEPGFPCYGRMAVVAVEPQRAWPYDGLGGAIGRGQALQLGPGESASSWISMTVVDSPPAVVTDVTRDGRVVGE